MAALRPNVAGISGDSFSRNPESIVSSIADKIVVGKNGEGFPSHLGVHVSALVPQPCTRHRFTWQDHRCAMWFKLTVTATEHF